MPIASPLNNTRRNWNLFRLKANPNTCDTKLLYPNIDSAKAEGSIILTLQDASCLNNQFSQPSFSPWFLDRFQTGSHVEFYWDAFLKKLIILKVVKCFFVASPKWSNRSFSERKVKNFVMRKALLSFMVLMTTSILWPNFQHIRRCLINVVSLGQTFNELIMFEPLRNGNLNNLSRSLSISLFLSILQLCHQSQLIRNQNSISLVLWLQHLPSLFSS